MEWKRISKKQNYAHHFNAWLPLQHWLIMIEIQMAKGDGAERGQTVFNYGICQVLLLQKDLSTLIATEKELISALDDFSLPCTCSAQTQNELCGWISRNTSSADDQNEQQPHIAMLIRNTDHYIFVLYAIVTCANWISFYVVWTVVSTAVTKLIAHRLWCGCGIKISDNYRKSQVAKVSDHGQIFKLC